MSDTEKKQSFWTAAWLKIRDGLYTAAVSTLCSGVMTNIKNKVTKS